MAELAHQISILSLLKLISIFKIWSMPVRNIASPVFLKQEASEEEEEGSTTHTGQAFL